MSLWAMGAQALGVGEIELNSHLNQKVVAEIPLIDASGLRADEVLVSLGTSEDFERAGVERFFYLTDLRFEVFVDGRGPRIRVMSRQPVTEPYLNFIVEVLWPNGRMLKEFTLLLDPPTYEVAVSRPDAGETSTQSTPAPEAVVATPASSGSANAPNQGSAYTRPERAAPPTPPSDGVWTNGQTLWSIAERYNPDASLTVGQYMLAIQRKNPAVFINENINRMRGGVQLQMPAAEDARELSPSEAAAEVARQTTDWRGGRVAATAPSENASETAQTTTTAPAQDEPELHAQMDASAPEVAAVDTTATDSTADQPTTGRLEIVGDTGDTGTAQSPAANADVTALQEENQRLERQVQELGYQSDREQELAASEIAVKDRQLEVKDQQLAELRKQLEDAEAQLTDRQGQPSEDQNQPEEPWWQSTMVLLAAGLIVVLAVAGVLVLVRRRKAVAATEVLDIGPKRSEARVEPLASTGKGSTPRATPAVAAAAGASAVDDLDEFEFLEDPAEDRISKVSSSAEEADAGRSSPTLQTSDVISEADIYAAYGRYPHAIGLLLGALDDNADRHDVRLKLLEVAVSANDTETFERHIQELVNRCEDQDILLAARELEESFTGNAVDRSYDSSGDVNQDGSVSDAPLADDDFSLDLDDDLLADDDAGIEGLDDLLADLDEVEERSATTAAAGSAGQKSADILSFSRPRSEDGSRVSAFSESEDPDDDGFDFGTAEDAAETKLDLAQAYIEMGDSEGAQDILNEVLSEGNPAQRQLAQSLLDNLAS